MNLPINPPVDPMLAKLSREMPVGDYLYEPKWDGFRCIVFRDGKEIELQSRNGKSLARYFPELLDPLREALPTKCVVDGEIVIASDSGLDFDALQLRIHPAESRVDMLAGETPASYVAFDLLAQGANDLTGKSSEVRRQRLEKMLAEASPPIHLTPMTRDAAVAADWFERFEGAGFDGVIAKSPGLPYGPGKRTMIKVKHLRTADCAVAGFRIHKDGKGVGSLMLGLYDKKETLHHVGVATSFAAKLRTDLLKEIEPFRKGAEDDHPWVAEGGTGTQDTPRGMNRWNAAKDMSWEPLRIELVAEVAYEGMQGDRFRHASRLVRLRHDRDPQSCNYAQLDTPVPAELATLLRYGSR